MVDEKLSEFREWLRDEIVFQDHFGEHAKAAEAAAVLREFIGRFGA